MKANKLMRMFSFENHLVSISILFIILIGLCSGVFLERGLPSDDKEVVFGCIESLFFTNDSKGAYTFLQIYFSYVKYSLVSLLFIYASSVLIVFIPFIILFAFWAGFSLGFTSTVLIDYYGFKGQGIIFTTVVPFCMINVFLTSLASCWGLTYSYNFLKALNVPRAINKKGASIFSLVDTPSISKNLKELSKTIIALFAFSMILYLIQAFLCSIIG